MEYINFIEVLVELSLTSGETEFLKYLVHSAGRYPDFARLLHENPEVEANLIGVANRAFESRIPEPISSTEIAMSMIGFFPARNYLAASITRKSNRLTPWDPTLREILHFALNGEEMGGELGSRYFAAGLIYDFVLHALKKTIKKGIVISNPKFVLDIWNHGLQICAISRNLANRLFSPEMEKEICFHALLHDIGKLVHCFIDESLTLEQTDNGVRVVPNFPEQVWRENGKKMGVSHDLTGYLVLDQLGFVPDSSWITLYHHQPFLAARRGETVHLYTTIIWLADQLSKYRELHRSARHSEKMLSGWYRILQPFLDIPEEKFKLEISRIVVR